MKKGQFQLIQALPVSFEKEYQFVTMLKILDFSNCIWQNSHPIDIEKDKELYYDNLCIDINVDHGINTTCLFTLEEDIKSISFKEFLILQQIGQKTLKFLEYYYKNLV